MGELRHTPTCSPLTHRHWNIVYKGCAKRDVTLVRIRFFPLASYYLKTNVKCKLNIFSWNIDYSNLFTEHLDKIV